MRILKDFKVPNFKFPKTCSKYLYGHRGTRRSNWR